MAVQVDGDHGVDDGARRGRTVGRRPRADAVPAHPEVLDKAEAVARAFAANVEKDPRMKRKLEAQREIAVLEKKDDPTEAEQRAPRRAAGDRRQSSRSTSGINGGSLSEISAQLTKIPAMAAALKTAGMAPPGTSPSSSSPRCGGDDRRLAGQRNAGATRRARGRTWKFVLAESGGGPNGSTRCSARGRIREP